MSAIPDVDIESELATQVAALAAAGGSAEIVGSGSKRFYGELLNALPLEVAAHSGIIDYDPAELVITLRAGCRLREVEALLAEHRQMFSFEAPHFGPEATIGGMVASGLAGPRRGFAGGIRDFVLGVKMLDGRGEVMQFGGRVIKNVAGFDLSRVLVGSLGTLGVILEVSIRVVPMFATEITLAFEHSSADAHIRWVNELGSQPFPLTASAWHDGTSRLRLSGSEQGVNHAIAELGGEQVDDDWALLREQKHAFFAPDQPLTRLSLPPASTNLAAGRAQLIEWGGAQRWLCGEIDIEAVRQQAMVLGGSVCAFRGHAADVAVFHPLAPAMLKLQRSIKSSLDPAGIFNAGRIYPGL
jgi:glycolate oxidase FAD binding subunit